MSLNNLSSLVKGEVIFSQELSSFSEATVNIYLEDVTFIDAPSFCISKQVIVDINHQKGTINRVEFALNGKYDENSRYIITAHVSINGSEEIQRGDYMTMESYPVLTFGYPNQVSIYVKEVK
ncbi:MAG: YbaY family lipoprotein [Rivularia sp. (in: cyanobacteria)]